MHDLSIYMYWRDHAPPHFHAVYGSDEVEIVIDDLSVLAGRLPPRPLGLESIRKFSADMEIRPT